MEKLRVENKAYRTLLNLQMSTAIKLLREAVGSSRIMARNVKNKLIYYKYTLCQTNYSLLKEIVRNDAEYQTEWCKKIKSYMFKVQITQEQLFYWNKEHMKKKMNELNTKQRREGIKSKSTLNIYREYKQEIKKKTWFLNNYRANIMIKARSNTLERMR